MLILCLEGLSTGVAGSTEGFFNAWSRGGVHIQCAVATANHQSFFIVLEVIATKSARHPLLSLPVTLHFMFSPVCCPSYPPPHHCFF